jgi:hypothetical protein
MECNIKVGSTMRYRYNENKIYKTSLFSDVILVIHSALIQVHKM